ncbi:MAG: hypothetical protein N3I35_00515 [Clostridia bacterium]|nr:hypothetical protein [Clostridia bacterium]
MNFIKIPNIPAAPVKRVIIDGRAGAKIEASLKENGLEIIRTNEHKGLYASVSHHPDMMLHHLGEEYIVYAPGLSSYMIEILKDYGFMLLRGQSRLESKYPGNIAYNAARVGNVVFHNLKYTDPVLKQELEKRGVRLVDTKQGYAKCSISVVNEKAIITGDKGIEKAALENGIEVLLLEQDENIMLPGMNYGFIGGSTGLIGKNKWAITGKLETIKSFDKICNFLNKYNMEIVSLSDERVIDVGSIIPVVQM